MYGIKERSWPQRIAIVGGECVFLALAAWLLFGHGLARLGLPEGDAVRREWLFGLCIATFVRMSFMALYLLKRGIDWGEAGGVLFAFAVYYVGFPLLGGTRDVPLDGWDALAVFLFAAGSILNSGSELLRARWKRDERNKGKLYTGGLFRYSVHVNYFGDVVWVGGLALLTRNLYSGIIPLLLLFMFVFVNIPQHDRYLRSKYGEAFERYERKTKKLIPFLY